MLQQRPNSDQGRIRINEVELLKLPKYIHLQFIYRFRSEEFETNLTHTFDASLEGPFYESRIGPAARKPGVLNGEWRKDGGFLFFSEMYTLPPISMVL